MKKVLSIVAVVFLVFGFGTIHSSNPIVERLGSVFIGMGALYFIVILLILKKKEKEKESHIE